MGVTSYKKLTVWQKSLNMVELVYEYTKAFPDEEKYGLTSQMRRCAVSVPSNIAEGYGRGGSKEFIQFLRVANGSCMELETQAEIARRMEFLSQKDYDRLTSLIEEVLKMLNKLRSSLCT